jgi:hypothetical protein
MQNYYTAKEAIKKLGITRNIFYELVKANEIPRVIVPSKKKAFYLKQRIDELAEQRARLLGEVEQTPERFVFVLPQRGDLEQLVDIERMFFHEAIIVPPEEQQKQLTYNSEAIHVLKDTKTNRVIGGTSISPIKPDVLEKLIRLEIDETQIRPADFLPYTSGTPLDCYIIDFAVRPGLIAPYYGRKLLQATLDYFIELLNRGVIIRCLYTSAITKDGERLAKRLHFTLLRSGWTREREDFRHSYVLDLENMESKSRLVERYLKQKRNLERRRKRNKKQRQARFFRKDITHVLFLVCLSFIVVYSIGLILSNTFPYFTVFGNCFL